MEIKARVNTDNGGYYVTDSSTEDDPRKAVEIFITAHKDRLIPGVTSFYVNKVRRFRWTWLQQLIAVK